VKNRTVIIIVAAALALFAFIFFIERGSMTSSELEGRKGRVFTEFRREAVLALTLKGASGQEVALEKAATADGTEGEWVITSPRKMAADAAAVRSVLSAIDFLLADRTVLEEGEADDPRYGLVAPRVTGSFTIGDERVAFRVGADDASGDKLYIAVDGAPGFHAVERDFLEAVDLDLQALRDKHLVEGSFDDAVEAVLARAGQELRFSREGSGPWRIARGGADILAASEQVNEVLGKVRELRAERFVADDVKDEELAAYGLDRPTRSLAVSSGKGPRLAVELGSPCGEGSGLVHATVKGSGTVACVPSDIADLMDRPASRFEELRPAVFLEEDVEKITISRGARTLALELDDEEREWRLAGDDTAVDRGAVAELLTLFREARAVELVAGDEAVGGLGEPAAVVRFDRDAGSEPVLLELFGAPGDETQTARRGEERAVLRVKADLIGAAVPDPLAFRERVLGRGDGARVTALTVEGPAAQRLEEGDGGWKIVSPVEVEADEQQARKLAETMARLEVERFVAPAAAPEHGLGAPWATVRADLVGEPAATAEGSPAPVESVTLELGARADDTGARFARFAGADKTVFVVAGPVAELVSRPLVARDRLRVATEGITRLELAAAGSILSARLDGGEWKSDERPDLDSVAVKRLLADLGALKAVSARSFDAAPPFDPVTLELKAWTAEDPDPAVLVFGPRSPDEKEDAYLARRGGLRVTFAAPSRLVDDLAALVVRAAP